MPGWAGVYRPVTAATIPILFVPGDGAAWPFHLANLLLHAAVSCLLAAAVARLSGRVTAAMAAGLLFAVHPIHAESVAWISGRSELLFAVCGAAAWCCHLRARATGRIGWGAAAVVLLAGSLGSKETGLCWPFVVLAADLLLPAATCGRPPSGAGGGWILSARSLMRSRGVPALYASYAFVSAAWLAWRFTVLGTAGRRPFEGSFLANPLEGDTWWPAGPFTFLRLTALAARKCLWPGPACLDYGFDQIPLAAGPLHIDVALAAAGLIALAWWASRSWLSGRPAPRRGLLLLAAAIFLLSWLPASSLLVPSVSIFAERNLYLPSFGWCLAAGVAADSLWERLPARRGRLAPAGALVLAILAALTLARNTLFLDGRTLFAASAGHCGRSARAHFLHASALEEAGRDAEAEAALRRALEIRPDYAGARAALAELLARQGRAEEAAREARASLDSRTSSVETRLSATAALQAAGLEQEAAEQLDSLARERPDDLRVLFVQAQRSLRQGRAEEALRAFERLRERHPGSPAGHDGSGAALMALGRDAEAEESLRRALAIDPYDASGLFNLGLLLMKRADDEGGSGGGRGDDGIGAAGRAGGETLKVAVRLFERYLRIAPRDALIWMRLGQALERLGDPAGAERALRRAVDLAPSRQQPRRALEELRRRRDRPAEPSGARPPG